MVFYKKNIRTNFAVNIYMLKQINACIYYDDNAWFPTKCRSPMQHADIIIGE